MKSLLFYSGLYGGSAALLKLVGFVFFLWLAHELPVPEFAQWGLLYAMQTAVTSFGAVGIIESTVGLLGSNPGEAERRRLFVAAGSVFVAVCVLAILVTSAVFALFSRTALNSPLTFVCVIASGALLAYASLQAQIVRLEERHFASLCFSFFVPLCGLAGSYFAFQRSPTVQSFYVGSTLGLSAALIAAAVGRTGLYGFTARGAEWRPLFSRIAPFVAVALLGWLGGYGNNFIIEQFFNLREVAAFTFVFMISSIMQLVATAMNQVWSPRFYRLLHETPIVEVERQNQRFFLLQGLALGATGAALVAGFPLAVKLIGGNVGEYAAYDDALLMLVLAYVVLTPWYQCQNYLLAYDRGPTVMNILVAVGVAGISMWIGLMLLLGVLGIYVGFLTQMALRSAGAYLVSRREWPVKISWSGMVGGTALVLLAFVFTRIFPFSGSVIP